MNAITTLPLSLTQQRFLLFNVNVSASIRFKGELSIPALSRALNFIIRRHEGLRMRVVRSNEGALQRLIDPTGSYELPVVSGEGMIAAEDRINALRMAPLDLEKDGPVYAELMRISADEYVLILIIHHIAIDACANDLFVRELLASYDCYKRDQEPSMPPPMQLSEQVLREMRCGEKLGDAQRLYWRSVLSGSRSPIPMRGDSAAQVAARMRVIISSITPTETESLGDFASRIHVSLAAALYAVILLAVWAKYCTADITVVVSYCGRDYRALETLGAPSVRPVLLRMFMNNRATLAEFVRQVQNAFIHGAIASRPPFTLPRAFAQVLGGGGIIIGRNGSARVF